MRFIKKVISLFVCLFLPHALFFWVLNLLGHKVHRRSKIGFSVIWLNGILRLDESAKIGHFNVLKCNSIQMAKGSYIGSKNKIQGPLDIMLHETAAIGNNNLVYRSPIGVSYGNAVLKLGILSKITGNHRVDCTRSVIFGNYSTLAGHESQLWTHAYYHDKSGPGRFRLDGEIEIGNNVYLGSKCVVNAGVKIADTVVVGSNTCVSKSLIEAGTYVNQPLRFIETDTTDARSKFQKLEGFDVCEDVYIRKK